MYTLSPGSYGAEYWEYDSRIIRRWNLDPVYNESMSRYACFNNNPIAFADPDGDIPKGIIGYFFKNIFKKGGWHRIKAAWATGHVPKVNVGGGTSGGSGTGGGGGNPAGSGTGGGWLKDITQAIGRATRHIGDEIGGPRYHLNLTPNGNYQNRYFTYQVNPRGAEDESDKYPKNWPKDYGKVFGAGMIHRTTDERNPDPNILSHNYEKGHILKFTKATLTIDGREEPNLFGLSRYNNRPRLKLTSSTEIETIYDPRIKRHFMRNGVSLRILNKDNGPAFEEQKYDTWDYNLHLQFKEFIPYDELNNPRPKWHSWWYGN
jgi:hypothetical protein